MSNRAACKFMSNIRPKELNNLCLEFVNSEWYDGWGHSEERLRSEQWRRKIFEAFGFPRLPEPDSGSMKQLVQLRSLLRDMIETAASGGEPKPRQFRKLNGFLSLTTWHFEIRRRRLERIPAEYCWRWFMTCVAASACELLLVLDRRRLRICPNPGCRWVFYDLTKGRTRRWCTPALCGNLDKVRRYRARKKAASKR